MDGIEERDANLIERIIANALVEARESGSVCGLFSTVEDASADRFRYAEFPLPMRFFDLLE